MMGQEQEKQHLELRQQQELRLTPQLLQSMEVLQMNAQELLDYLSRAVEENPLLERQEPVQLQREYLQLRQRIEWLGETGRSSVSPRLGWEASAEDWEKDSLSAFLRDQLDRMALEEPLASTCAYLAELVDEDGYLPAEELSAVRKMGVPDGLIYRAVQVLQSLDPAGIAAEDLASCLTLQLRRMRGDHLLAEQIVNSCLPQLGRRQYGAIARKLGASERDVRAAADIIAALEPRPGRAFGGEKEQTAYVRPDLFVFRAEDGWQVISNEYYLPRLQLSSYYTRLLAESSDTETKTYLRERLQNAKETLSALEKRQTTLRRCGEVILHHQLAFFSGESGDLQPMSLRQLAHELAVHPSTVSRALRGKYLQCARGTYPIRYFFSLPSGGVSRQSVHRRLLELIGGEDSAHPLSDEKLSALLREQGLAVPRRTVAKYRMQLGVPAASGRKRR